MNTTRRKFIENSFKATAIVAASPLLSVASNITQIVDISSENPLNALQFSQVAFTVRIQCA